MKAKTLLVTIIIGKAYSDHWRKYCAPNWRHYADAHGYDVMSIERPLDDSDRARNRSVAWQKCLVLGQEFSKAYDRVVWIDADIVINPSAPPVDAGVPIEKVGAVRAYSTPTREEFLEAYDRLLEFYEAQGIKAAGERTPGEYHRNFGLPEAGHDDVVQTGVLVMSPQYHRELLEKVYFEYEDRGESQWHYEMRPLSHELQHADAVHWMNTRFNQGWLPYQVMHYPFLLNRPATNGILERIQRRVTGRLGIAPPVDPLRRACATTAFVNNYFLHFAASIGEIRLVDQCVQSWREVSNIPLRIPAKQHSWPLVRSVRTSG